MATQASLDKVQQFYVAYYGRPADPTGQEAWADLLDANGGDLTAIIDAFGTSPEAEARFGGQTSAETIETLYQQLFGRAVETQEVLDAWVFQLENNPDVTLQSIAVDLLTAAQNDDKTVIDNKTAVANNFTAALDTQEEIDAYAGTAAIAAGNTLLNGVDAATDTAAVDVATPIQTLVDDAGTTDPGTPGTTFTLTDSQDNIVGGDDNDTILAVDAGAASALTSFTLGDVINGGAGTDTLKLTTNQNAVNVATATISNVENLEVNADAVAAPGNAGASEAANAVDLNDVAFSTVTIEGVTGDEATTGNSDTLAVTNADLSTTIVLEDLTDVSSTITYTGAATGTADVATVEIAGATENTATGRNNDLTVDNVETLNLSLTTAANTLNVVTADNATTVNLTVSDEAATLAGAADFSAATAVNITANADLTLSATADLADEVVITVTGSGDVDLNSLDASGGDGNTLDASAMTGDLAVVGAASTASITSGSGDDNVTSGAITTSVDLGAGDDTFSAGNLDLGGATAVDVEGGEGNDTFIITNGTRLDADAAAHIKNFETLDIVGGQGSYDQDVYDFTAVNVSGAIAADAAITNITDEALNITGSVDTGGHAVSYALKDASGDADALTVNIEGVFSNAGTAADTTDDANDLTVDELVFNNIETVTLNSGDNDAHTAGVNNTVSLLDTNATKLVVTGDHALEITAFEGDVDPAATGTANTSIATIDASASGGLIMGAAVETANVSLLGSDFADTLIIGETGGDGATGADGVGSTINAGKGGDSITITDDGALDTLIVEAGDSGIGYADANDNGSYDEGEELHDTVVGFTSGEDVIDLGSFGFTGQAASALAGPALTPAAAEDLVDGTTTEIANFFVDTGVQRAVAVVSGDFDNIDGTATADDATNDTLVFIDTNGDGNLTVGTDEMLVLTGVTGVTLADFGF